MSNQADCAARGRLIVFEGLDGSGKTTQMELLSRRLTGGGMRVYPTAEPTDSLSGGIIRDVLAGRYPADAYEQTALFLKDRISHNRDPERGIEHFIGQGVHVLCDRYYYSSFAYQGLAADLQWVLDCNLNCKLIRKPDLCIFLDSPVEQCIERMKSTRSYLDLFEGNVETMTQVRENFMQIFELLKDTENIRIVSGDRPVDEIADEIYRETIKIL